MIEKQIRNRIGKSHSEVQRIHRYGNIQKIVLRAGSVATGTANGLKRRIIMTALAVGRRASTAKARAT